MAMLEINDLHVNYGMIAALKGISFEVNEGEVISLIGANGAGKTTTLHTITGLISAKSGSIKFNGVELTKTPAHKIVEMGIAHVPEGRRIFQNLTVLDNLKLGAFTRKDKENISKDIQDIYERFPRLSERKNQIAGTLSGGEQQMLAMGRALMSRPKIVVMDEPSMGLSPILVSTIFKIIEDDPDDHDFTSDRNLFNYQAKIIKQLADREPAVIVGRCADYILRDRKDVLKVFIYSDMETAVKNIVDLYGVSEKEAVKIIEKTDKERSDYYRHYTGRDWTNAKNYNLCLDTSDMSYDKCVDIIEGYIKLLEE